MALPESFYLILLCATFVFSVSLWLFLRTSANHRGSENTKVAQRSPLGQSLWNQPTTSGWFDIAAALTAGRSGLWFMSFWSGRILLRHFRRASDWVYRIADMIYMSIL